MLQVAKIGQHFGIRPSEIFGFVNDADAIDFDTAAVYKLEENDRTKRRSLARMIAYEVLSNFPGVETSSGSRPHEMADHERFE